MTASRNNSIEPAIAPTRIGLAKLTKMAFDQCDLGPCWTGLLDAIKENPGNLAAAMDMSVIAQLNGDRESGFALQTAALNTVRCYRSPCASSSPSLRVLALAGATDIGGNTPIEFLLEESDIELFTLYLVPGKPVPETLPDHDVVFVSVSTSEAMRATLEEAGHLARCWSRPVINAPEKIAELDRDRLHILLNAIPGLFLPKTERITASQLKAIGSGGLPLQEILPDGVFPLIVRPVDSHAGRGLARLDASDGIAEYLAGHDEAEFFISRFIDYSSTDGLFRKYRVVVIDGQPYPCHMAISDQWKIWYLNAGMAESASKRAEEERFMMEFPSGFALRHREVLAEISRRVGLEYFAIDCAETKTGELLLFEGDNAMIVHNMDPVDVYPYKPFQMRKIFDAFGAMLHKYARPARTRAAA